MTSLLLLTQVHLTNPRRVGCNSTSCMNFALCPRWTVPALKLSHYLYAPWCWNTYHLPQQNHPVMYVNIPAPWSTWVILKSSQLTNFRIKRTESLQWFCSVSWNKTASASILKPKQATASTLWQTRQSDVQKETKWMQKSARLQKFQTKFGNADAGTNQK